MAPRKKVPTPEWQDDLPDTGLVPMDALPPDVMNVMRELGDDVAKVYVERRLPGGKRAWVETFDAGEFSIAEVGQRFGGGRYLARLQSGDGGFIQGFTFYIDESRKPAPLKEDTPVPAFVDRDRQLLDKLLDKTLEGGGGKGDMNSAVLVALINSQAESQRNMLTLLVPVLSKMAEGPRGGGGGMNELMAAIELGSQLGGKGEGDSWLPLVREVGVPLVQAMQDYMTALKQRAAERAAAVPAVRPALPAPVPVVAGSGVTPVASAPNPNADPLARIAPWVPKLCDFAHHGAEPREIAAMVRAHAPDVARWLEAVVGEPGFMAQLLTKYPALAAADVAPWVDRLLDEFDVIEDEEEEEEATVAGHIAPKGEPHDK